MDTFTENATITHWSITSSELEYKRTLTSIQSRLSASSRCCSSLRLVTPMKTYIVRICQPLWISTSLRCHQVSTTGGQHTLCLTFFNILNASLRDLDPNREITRSFQHVFYQHLPWVFTLPLLRYALHSQCIHAIRSNPSRPPCRMAVSHRLFSPYHLKEYHRRDA